MEFKISKYIAELLTHYGQVKVKGLGTFISNNKPINAGQPRENLRANPELDEDILLKHIMTITGMDSAAAKKFISEEVAQIKAIVDTGELVYLKQIGHLYKSHLGKSVFLPEKSNVNQFQFLSKQY